MRILEKHLLTAIKVIATLALTSGVVIIAAAGFVVLLAH
jgi:hypothetical protein